MIERHIKVRRVEPAALAEVQQTMTDWRLWAPGDDEECWAVTRDAERPLMVFTGAEAEQRAKRVADILSRAAWLTGDPPARRIS